jgi:hypothetical protein
LFWGGSKIQKNFFMVAWKFKEFFFLVARKFKRIF